MMTDEDFGGPDLPPAPAPREELGNVVAFPNMRPNAKLGEVWSSELARTNTRLERRYVFPTPLEAAARLARKRTLPCLPWPAAWPELGKRARLYVGEAAGVVGPTGGGKTSFAIQCGIAARAEGIPVLWNPLELDDAEVDLRIVANMNATHTSLIRETWADAQIANSLAAIDDLWRYIPRELDVARQLEAYRVAIRLAKDVYRRPPLLVIDYIGKLARGARDPRLAIADAAEAIREMVVAEECFAIILAQPSRSNNALLTGKSEIEAATDAVGVAGESAEIEHACAVMLGLNVFKADDAAELDAHVLVTKARGTGREGRQGFRFHKPGGVWEELPYLPATPGEIKTEVKRAKKDKARVEPATPTTSRAELNATRSHEADVERRARICAALIKAGPAGLSEAELRKAPGTGKSQRMHQSLQELERQGAIERLIGAKRWRYIPR